MNSFGATLTPLGCRDQCNQLLRSRVFDLTRLIASPSMLLAALLAPASYVRPTPLSSRAAKRPAFPRTGTILLEAPSTLSLYEQYLQTRQAGAYPAKSYEPEPRRPGAATAPAPAPMSTATATVTVADEPAPAAAMATAAQWLEWEETGTVPPEYYAAPPPMFLPTSQAAPRGVGADWRVATSAPDAGGTDWSPGWSRPGGGLRHLVAGADPNPNPNPSPNPNPNPNPSSVACLRPRP